MTRRRLIEGVVDCTMVAILTGLVFYWLWSQAEMHERAKQRTEQRERNKP